MTDRNSSRPGDAAFRDLAAAVDQHRRASAGGPEHDPEPHSWPARIRGWLAALWLIVLALWSRFDPWFLLDRRHPVVRRLTIAVIAVFVLGMVGTGALWWRLSSGPIALDIATPWLTSAIEQNLGGRYQVKVGGTQIERDAQGHTAVRLREIVVRDAGGALVARAPKAEVGLFGTSLLVASPRAASFRLVDASVEVRIGGDGRIDVFAGGERPLVSLAADTSSNAPGGFSLQSLSERSTAANLLALLAWVANNGHIGRDAKSDAVPGFDGQDLNEIGILNSTLTIDNQLSGHKWQHSEVTLLLVRPLVGGMALSVGSSNNTKPWLLNVAVTPDRRGHRHLQVQARKILLDDMLALRMSDSQIRCDALVSAAIEAEFATDGTPQMVRGNVLVEGGSIHRAGHAQAGMPIDHFEAVLDWDITRRTLRVPLKVTSGPARMTLRAEVAPSADNKNWKFALGGGWIVLDALSPKDEGLVLRRIQVRGTLDTVAQRISLEQADLGTSELGGSKDVSLALSGNLSYGAEPRFSMGLVANQMNVASMKRIWPVPVAPRVREWVIDHIGSGTITRLEIATNAPVTAFNRDGPWLEDDELSVKIDAVNAVLQPVIGLPTIRDADLSANITGRTAKVTLGKGIVDVSAGRRLTLTNGVFEVPDVRHDHPPASVNFQVEGIVPAAAEILASERLRDFSGTPFDPATSRGNLSAQVRLSMPLRHDLPRGATRYDINVDINNFSADKMMLGQKVEANALQVAANNQGYQIRGEVRVAGVTAQVDYRRLRAEPDAEFRLHTTLDEVARARFGLNLGAAATGPLPVKLSGRIGDDEKDARIEVDADLTPMVIDGLLPGWGKPSGKPARAVFKLVRDKKLIRFDDLLIDGQGVLVKGNVVLDAKGEIELANFPVFATSDGDKTMVRAERGSDGVLRVAVRGDVYDGRIFVKSSLGGPNNAKSSTRASDLDLDIKLGVVAGHHGEALRGLELRLSRRAGRIRTFNLGAKIGRDTPLTGELRRRLSNNRQVVYFETNDAGALFRFTDVYARMVGGRVWVGMDPPGPDLVPQEGVIQVHDFAIRGEQALDRVVANAPDAQRVSSVEFSLARAEFVRTPGRIAIRDGIVNGPTIGATIDGTIDFGRDDVNVRGTLVPLYGLNNMFGQIPIVGLFLGGSREGLLGITYEVRGPTGNPRPVINPLSAIAPGLLRKFFEFRDPNTASSFVEPTR